MKDLNSEYNVHAREEKLAETTIAQEKRAEQNENHEPQRFSHSAYVEMFPSADDWSRWD